MWGSNPHAPRDIPVFKTDEHANLATFQVPLDSGPRRVRSLSLLPYATDAVVWVRSSTMSMVGADGFEPPHMRATTARITRLCYTPWCEEVDSNHRHDVLQTTALPTELSSLGTGCWNRTNRTGFWRPCRLPWNMPRHYLAVGLRLELSTVGLTVRSHHLGGLPAITTELLFSPALVFGGEGGTRTRNIRNLNPARLPRLRHFPVNWSAWLDSNQRPLGSKPSRLPG